jgi:hypothetical protein
LQDNVNNHDGASLREAFPPARAHRILERIEINFMMRSNMLVGWLNIAETEISIMNRQC